MALYELVLFLAFIKIYCNNTKLCICFTIILQLCETDSAQVKELPKEEETRRKKKHHHRPNRAATDSGVSESLENRDSLSSITEG